MIFLLMFIHEMGHIAVAKLFKHKVHKIIVYPFGFSATIEHFNYIQSKELFLIIIGGIGFHFIYPFIFKILYDYDLISYVYYQYMNQMNTSILLFNLLPIYPLDGGRLLFSILRSFFNYKSSKKVTLFISICTNLCLFIFCKVSMKIILIFILYLIILEIIQKDEDYVQYQYYQMSVSK